MEKQSLDFTKFVEDLETREALQAARKKARQQQDNNWAPRRKLELLYREHQANRIYYNR